VEGSGAELAAESTLSGVVLQQVSEHFGAGQVVDSNDLVTLSVNHLAESQTTDTAEAVNSNLNRHDKNLRNFEYMCLLFLPFNIVYQNEEKYNSFS
jgi:hypothetical protein